MWIIHDYGAPCLIHREGSAHVPGTMTSHMSSEERAEARRTAATMYRDGATVRAIAKATGMSYGWVHRALEAEDVQMRPRGGKR